MCNKNQNQINITSTGTNASCALLAKVAKNVIKSHTIVSANNIVPQISDNVSFFLTF